jgi:dipeptidyl aminopeptidase/acylaminoacyl peptidase
VFPTYSPDGTKIAYCHCHDSDTAIHVMNTGGSGQMVVADIQLDTVGPPVWSPDGTRLIFEALVSVTNGHSDYNYDIYSVNAGGTGVVDLTPTTGRTENSPVWAPDGTKIAFEASAAMNGENAGTYDIYLMNPNGTGEQRLTADQHAGGFDLAWQAVLGGGTTPEASGTPATETTSQVHPHIATNIDIGQPGQASSVLAAEGSIWVAGYESVGSGWVKRIDPSTNEVTATIPPRGRARVGLRWWGDRGRGWLHLDHRSGERAGGRPRTHRPIDEPGRRDDPPRRARRRGRYGR